MVASTAIQVAMRRPLLLSAVVIVAACAGPASEASGVAAVHGKPTSPANGLEPTARASDAARVVEATIVEEGPLGDGPCVQRSYRVQATGGGEAIWIHFERCQDADGPSPDGRGLESLDVGKSFRFTLRDAASPNFGDAPIVLDAAPVASSR